MRNATTLDFDDHMFYSFAPLQEPLLKRCSTKYP